MEQITQPTEQKKRGRKPSGIKKEPLFFYVETSLIEKLSKAEIRNKIQEFIKTL